VCERSRFLAWDFLEGSAVIDIKRRGRASWIFVGVLIIVGFLGLRWVILSEAQAQERDLQIEELRQAEQEARARAEAARRLAVQAQDEAVKKVEELRNAAVEAAKQAEELARAVAEAARKAAPLPQRHFLEKGKSYVFCWQQLNIGPAVVLEEPRDNWVQVRADDTDQWITLSMVHLIMVVREGKEKKDIGKGAVEAKGTVKGVVTFLGKPVPKGTVAFHPEQGNAVEAEIKDGQCAAKDVPVGSLRVTVTAEGLPEKYAGKEQTPLRFQVQKGENQVTIVHLHQVG
jgi:hypothetical protein